MKKSRWLAVAAVVPFALAGTRVAMAQEPDQVTASVLADATTHSSVVTPHAHQNGQAHARHGIPNIDSLVNFNGHFFADGFTFDGTPNNHWYFNTVGNPPQMHGTTTTLNAPVVPVTLDLRNADGTPRFVNGQPLISHPDPFITPTLNSPVFQNATYSSSSVPTQITDAVMRASYFDQAKDDWHTVLAPSVKTGRTMVLNAGTYSVRAQLRRSCCAFVLIDSNAFSNAFFPPTSDDTTTPIGAAENAGDITTQDVSTFLFPNAYLFEGSVSNCCVLGFHTYDFEPGDDSNGNVEKRYVLAYASWISPGLFRRRLRGRHRPLSRDLRDLQRPLRRERRRARRHALVAGAQRPVPEQPRDGRRHRGPAGRRFPDHAERHDVSPAERDAAALVRVRVALERHRRRLQLSERANGDRSLR